MKIFSVGNRDARLGVKVEERHLKGADITISVISVGERGRGRSEMYIPISGAEPDTLVTNVSIGKTRTGNPKFIALKENEDTDTKDKCIVVMLHSGGYRGGATITGDRLDWDDPNKGFHPFPGLIMAEGYIAQGAAGRMGGNTQYIAELPANQVFRIFRSGRLYGDPQAMYGMYDGEKVRMVSWNDRVAAELWFGSI